MSRRASSVDARSIALVLGLLCSVIVIVRPGSMTSLGQLDCANHRRKHRSREQRVRGGDKNGTTKRSENQLACIKDPTYIGHAEALLAHFELANDSGGRAGQLRRRIIQYIESDHVSGSS